MICHRTSITQLKTEYDKKVKRNTRHNEELQIRDELVGPFFMQI
ncbi:hypothetical protein [Borrelia miyamotoi]|nr:hypothetical protein [Borrelia miyamotoi]